MAHTKSSVGQNSLEHSTGFWLALHPKRGSVSDHALSRSVPSSCDTFASLRLFLASKRERVFCLRSSTIDLNARIYFRLPYLVTLNLVGKHFLPKMVTLLFQGRAGYFALEAPPTSFPSLSQCYEKMCPPPLVRPAGSSSSLAAGESPTSHRSRSSRFSYS